MTKVRSDLLTSCSPGSLLLSGGGREDRGDGVDGASDGVSLGGVRSGCGNEDGVGGGETKMAGEGCVRDGGSRYVGWQVSG